MADEKMKEKKAEEEWEKYRNERKLYWWTRSDEEDAKRIYIDGFRKGQNLSFAERNRGIKKQRELKWQK